MCVFSLQCWIIFVDSRTFIIFTITSTINVFKHHPDAEGSWPALTRVFSQWSGGGAGVAWYPGPLIQFRVKSWFYFYLLSYWLKHECFSGYLAHISWYRARVPGLGGADIRASVRGWFGTGHSLEHCSLMWTIDWNKATTLSKWKALYRYLRISHGT